MCVSLEKVQVYTIPFIFYPKQSYHNNVEEGNKIGGSINSRNVGEWGSFIWQRNQDQSLKVTSATKQ